MIHVESRHLNGVAVLRPDVHGDARGWFIEAWRADQFETLGLPTRFVQENHSRSARGVLRGLHFQWEPAVGKLMRVIVGRAFLVAVDIRRKSPTLGQWHGIEVDAESKRQVWAPAGFARGFLALEEGTELQYKCTGTYNPKCEAGILWNDPAIGIDWPLTDAPRLSDKDTRAQSLEQWLDRPESDNF